MEYVYLLAAVIVYHHHIMDVESVCPPVCLSSPFSALPAIQMPFNTIKGKHSIQKPQYNLNAKC